MHMVLDGKTRAKGVDLPSWWMDKVRAIVDDRKKDLGESLVELGDRLASAVGRPQAWNHSSVSRFLSENNPTIDMAEAFAELLGIPKPFFTPRSFDEALSLQQVSRRYDAKQLNPDQERRLDKVDRALDAAEAEVRGQRQGVGSQDEGRVGRGRRVGRSDRSRS